MTESPASTTSIANPSAKRILIVDDHPVFRIGLADLVSQQPDLVVCGHADAAPAALERMRALKPDLAIVDISLGGTNGIELIKMMKAEVPRLPILVLSVHDESLYALRALRAGALGYLMKAEAVQHVVAAIRRVLEGKIFVTPRFADHLIFKSIQSVESGSGDPVDQLSDREIEVLELLGKGENTRSVAKLLNLSVKTIETHRAHIKEKLGLKDSSEMIRFAIDWVAQRELH
ncbi:MAG: response regulator transcription factor [Chthoniobacterales bacterium]